jgi:hypothetical protein
MTKLFCNFCWISRLGDVLERRFDLDTRKRLFDDVYHHRINPQGQSPSLWLTAKVLHCAGRCEMAEAKCYRPE